MGKGEIRGQEHCAFLLHFLSHHLLCNPKSMMSKEYGHIAIALASGRLPPFVLYHLYRSDKKPFKSFFSNSSQSAYYYYPFSSTIDPAPLALRPGKESVPKAATTTRAVSLITLTPVTFFLSFAAVRNSIAVDSIASLTTAYS